MHIYLPEHRIERYYFRIEGCDTLVGECNCDRVHNLNDWKNDKGFETLKNVYYIRHDLNIPKGYKGKSNNNLKAGTRIIFIKELSDGPSDESPGNLYAREGEKGWIDKKSEYTVGRYNVYWDNWKSAAFSATHLKDFVIDPIEYGEQLKLEL